MPIRFNVSEQDYHGRSVTDPQELSYSTAKRLLEPGGAAVVRWNMLHPQPPSQAMRFGTAAHAHVLRQEATPSPLVSYPSQFLTPAGSLSVSRKTVDALEAWKLQQPAGAVLVTPLEMEQLNNMRDVLTSSFLFNELLHGDPLFEVSLWTDEESGFLYDGVTATRGRVDMVTRVNGKIVLVDYKTTTSPLTDHGLMSVIQNNCYYMQAAHYLQLSGLFGVGASEFWFVFQSKTPPFLSRVVKLSSDWVGAGLVAMGDAVGVWRGAWDAGVWPGVVQGLVPDTLGAPGWATLD